MQAQQALSTAHGESSASLSPFEIAMLAAMRHALQGSILPELSSELAKTHCGFSIEYLDKLLARHTVWPAFLRRQLLRQAQVLQRMVALLQPLPGLDAGLVENGAQIARSVLLQPGESLQELEQNQLRVDAALEQIAPLVLSDGRLRSGDALDTVNALLREQVDALQESEQAFVAASKERVDRHAAHADSRLSVTRESMETYLRSHFPQRPGIEITAFHELPGGSSKSTILIDVRGIEHDGVTPLVVRLDRVAGSTDTRVLGEVPTLRAMAQLGIPAPQLVWEETDAAQLGVQFVVVRKIDGVLGGNMWRADPQFCNAETARNLARILARLHTLDTKQLGLRGALNSDPAVHPMRGLIDNIRRLWSAQKLEPDGTLETCVCWLEQNMPPMPARPSLIHADVSFHNIMVKDWKISGLLDWELSHLGDPNEDLSYARPCVEQLIRWEEFLAEYRRHGGGDYSEEIGRYYGVWRDVRNTIYGDVCKRSFMSGANPDMRWGYFSTYHRLQLLEAAAKVAAAGMPQRG
jgi:aminoglycoside phosphotransferase (APT) family kinase protein